MGANTRRRLAVTLAPELGEHAADAPKAKEHLQETISSILQGD
jgi:hypothetical protein